MIVLRKRVNQTNKVRISAIAAIGKNRELGKNNKLLWHLPGDLPRFKRITRNHPIIMGRKTYESNGRLLPKRVNIIVTRNSDFAVEGAIIVHSVKEAIERAKEIEKHKIFIIGGAEIFKIALPFVDRLYLTVVDESTSADVFFPPYDAFSHVIKKKEFEGEGHVYAYYVLEKS